MADDRLSAIAIHYVPSIMNICDETKVNLPTGKVCNLLSIYKKDSVINIDLSFDCKDYKTRIIHISGLRKIQVTDSQGFC